MKISIAELKCQYLIEIDGQGLDFEFILSIFKFHSHFSYRIRRRDMYEMFPFAERSEIQKYASHESVYVEDSLLSNADQKFENIDQVFLFLNDQFIKIFGVPLN
jgi:hypothetical protein